MAGCPKGLEHIHLWFFLTWIIFASYTIYQNSCSSLADTTQIREVTKSFFFKCEQFKKSGKLNCKQTKQKIYFFLQWKAYKLFMFDELGGNQKIFFDKLYEATWNAFNFLVLPICTSLTKGEKMPIWLVYIIHNLYNL